MTESNLLSKWRGHNMNLWQVSSRVLKLKFEIWIPLCVLTRTFLWFLEKLFLWSHQNDEFWILEFALQAVVRRWSKNFPEILRMTPKVEFTFNKVVLLDA